ncbi:metallopeptidase family protein [Kytococcus sedentarius]|uniref:metallopeptidase family protein n=1 Tax=Actinomycetes TaxID=1760 RepID=UPI000B061D87|nr:metallopeptidase family protein [Kytococcus sedentarius]MCM3899413.1 metallopeptidase family protein [Schaalia meyeri]
MLSKRRHLSSRNRHGRGPRGPLFFPGTPAWRTRREDFDLLVKELVSDLIRRWPQVATIEFAVEDVPPSDPAPWEPHNVVVARVFPADRRRALRDRIVVYRLPIVQRCPAEEVAATTRRVLVERISHILALPPDEIDDALA